MPWGWYCSRAVRVKFCPSLQYYTNVRYTCNWWCVFFLLLCLQPEKDAELKSEKMTTFRRMLDQELELYEVRINNFYHFLNCHDFLYVWFSLAVAKMLLKPLDTFGTENKLKVHRFTNNLQGLQQVMVKDFSWNIIPWNALLFEKTFKQCQYSISRITDLF